MAWGWIGVASGYAVSRAGDWFGSPVNVASRVTAAASPGTALVAEIAPEAKYQDYFHERERGNRAAKLLP